MRKNRVAKLKQSQGPNKIEGFNIVISKTKIKGKEYRRWIASRSVSIKGKNCQMNVYLGTIKPSRDEIAKKIDKYLSARSKLYNAIYGVQQYEFDFMEESHV